MEKKVIRKLNLRKDTIRALTCSELLEIAGGRHYANTNSSPSTCLCVVTEAILTCGICC